jgi:PAS domain-containing protein
MLVSGTDAAGRITFANQAFVDISGFSEPELVGHCWRIPEPMRWIAGELRNGRSGF